MTPHIITIYNYIDAKFFKKTLYDVYLYGTDSINVSGKGIVEAGAYNLIITNDNLNDYVSYKDFEADSGKYTIFNNSRIIEGEGPDIEDFNDLLSYKEYSVFGINENIVGSPLDNVMITLK